MYHQYFAFCEVAYPTGLIILKILLEKKSYQALLLEKVGRYITQDDANRIHRRNQLRGEYEVGY